jgi:hypothetical protein
MFVQVTSTIFELMVDFEFLWKHTYESRPSSIFGFGLGNTEKPPDIEVDTDKLFQVFMEGFLKYSKVWKGIIPLPEWRQILELKKIKKKESFYYPTSLWARILFNFAVAYKVNRIDRNTVLESLIPFYFSRVLAFVNKTIEKDTRGAEMYLENINRVFETEKFYLMNRWDSSLNSNERKFFD